MHGGSSLAGSLSPLEQRLRQAGPKLNGRRQGLFRAILDSSDQTVFLSSRQLARRCGVDPSTIVRSIQALGYKRFGDFAADLRHHFVSRLTPYAILQATTRERRSVPDSVRHSLEKDLENLQRLKQMPMETVVALADRIHRSRRILVAGVDLAAFLAGWLAYLLTALGFHADAPVGSSGSLLHSVRTLGPKDLLIAISFGRCLRETVEAVQRAHDRQVPTFGVTDAATTPLARYCDDYLLASISSPSFAGSYAAPTALLNAIVVACTQRTPHRSLSVLRGVEAEYREGARWYQDDLATKRNRVAVGGHRNTRARAPRSASE